MDVGAHRILVGYEFMLTMNVVTSSRLYTFDGLTVKCKLCM